MTVLSLFVMCTYTDRCVYDLPRIVEVSGTLNLGLDIPRVWVYEVQPERRSDICRVTQDSK